MSEKRENNLWQRKIKYIVYGVLAISIAVLLTLISSKKYEKFESQKEYVINNIHYTTGLVECIQNTYFEKGKYLNFDQYLFVNKNKLDSLMDKLNTLKDVKTKVLSSDKDGLVKSLLSYSINNKTYKCIFTSDFSKKGKKVQVLGYE